MDEVELLFFQAKQAEAIGDYKTMEVLLARLSRLQHKMSEKDVEKYQTLEKSLDIVWK